MTKARVETIRESALPHGSVIARSDQREGRGNPSCPERRVRGCGSLPGSQWIATGYALAMTRRGRECGTIGESQWIATPFRLAMTTHGLRQYGRVPCPTAVSLRGGTNGRDAAIHRVSQDAYGVGRSLTGSQWIATGYALAMTRRSESAGRLARASGSPRLSGSR
jgi:hypothetical protein